jgi:hypothetical protein
VQFDITGLHPAVNDAAYVLRDQRSARQHDPFGTGLGATRVHQPQGIVVADNDFGYAFV